MTEFSKNDFINDIIYEMNSSLDPAALERLRVVLTVKMIHYDIIPSKQLPSNEVKSNEWIIKRFMIDKASSGLEKSTIAQYARAAANFLNYTRLNYNDVTSQDVIDYLALKQYNDSISSSYKAALRRYLNAFFNWAWEMDHIDTNIMKKVPQIKFTRKKKERLSDEEVERCRIAAKDDPKSSALLELMLSTGMRVGEICVLKVENLDFHADEIHIWGEKTNEERIGFMNPSCKIALLRYLNGRTSGLVFRNRRGYGAVCKETIERAAKGIAQEAGCHVNATVHIYRKTFASITYRRTNDILLVSRLLGHADTETTIKYYLVDDIEDMKYRVRKAA